MRMKFLRFAACLLLLPLAVTSCLNSDDNYELSSDNIITAFEIDEIYGVTYKFTIDQKEKRIFNADSVPFSADTIINKTLIKIQSNGYITAGIEALQDTLFNTRDSIDLLNTMEEPLVLRSRSYDGEHIDTYYISVRIHKTDPDSLVWGGGNQMPASTSFSGGTVKDNWATKSVVLNNKVLVFASESDQANVFVYSQPTAPSDGPWTQNPTTLEPSTNVSSIISYNNSLYAVNEEGKAFSSTDGINWSNVESDMPVTTLITTFGKEDATTKERTDEAISGITSAELTTESGSRTVLKFSRATVKDDGSLVWAQGDTVPDNFPIQDLVATKSFKTTTGLERVIAVGNEVVGGEKPTVTTPWFSLEGLEWAAIEPTSEKYALPLMSDPSIIYYNNRYYAFGSGFSAIYTSVEGRMWKETEEKFLFPSDKETGEPLFENRGKYSMVVDNDSFIWLIWRKEAMHNDEIWKGRLNKLGFIIQ